MTSIGYTGKFVTYTTPITGVYDIVAHSVQGGQGGFHNAAGEFGK